MELVYDVPIALGHEVRHVDAPSSDLGGFLVVLDVGDLVLLGLDARSRPAIGSSLTPLRDNGSIGFLHNPRRPLLGCHCRRRLLEDGHGLFSTDLDVVGGG